MNYSEQAFSIFVRRPRPPIHGYKDVFIIAAMFSLGNIVNDLQRIRMKRRLLEVVMNETCVVCKRTFEPSKFATWVGPNDEPIEIPEFDTALAEVDDVIVCEGCYFNGEAEKKCKGQFDLHYQFGLEFIRAERTTDARSALESAVSINAMPDALVSLAHTHEGQQRIDLLIQAIKIDPNCELARLNLINEGLDPDEIAGLH